MRRRGRGSAGRCRRSRLRPIPGTLRTLHESREHLNVLAFPCDQFGKQEPGTNAKILEFAQSKFGVNFPMFAKIEVNGHGAAPLYQFLRDGAPREDGVSDISWNFAKFLVDGQGKVVKRYTPKTTPEEIAADLDAALAKS